MAFRNIVTHVNGSTTTLLFTAQAGDLECWVDFEDTVTFFIGGSTVDSANGLRVYSHAGIATADQKFHTRIRPGDELYGWMSLTAGSDAHVLVRSA